jgi:hypothetical protein
MMSLLQEVHKIMKMTMPKLRDRNFVAKHAQRAGAGVHQDKTGPTAPRHRQKHEWKKELHRD